MKAYTKGQETKRSFVLLTYKMLQERDAGSITVRDLASKLGYSPATIYRYFGSLNELIVVASVHFLNQYMQKYAELLDSNQEMQTIYMEGWKLFNQYAFERPDIFYRLFWGEYNNSFADAIEEYYMLFPFSGSEKFPAYFYTMFFSDSIYDRDYQILHRVVNQGKISDSAAKFISRTNPLIAKGLLAECIDSNLTPEEREKKRVECDHLLVENLLNAI